MALAFNEGDNGFLGLGLFEGAIFRLSANIGLVNFNDLVLATKRAARGLRAKAHRFANAMRQKPSRAVGTEPKVAYELMRGNALLARCT